jgi:hypothetical protein
VWHLFGVEKIQNGGCCHGNQGANIFTPPFFVSMATAAKFIQPIHQVSSISVRRGTCYDQICAFQFFSILAVSMATATLKSTTSHDI